jgi:hypothetical protein
VAENKYQAKLIKKLKRLFPGCVVLKNDSAYIQGMLDLTVLYRDRWATLEVKDHEGASELEGVEQHRYAAICIDERIVQDDETTTLGLYINQSIQYRMSAEVVLFYSPNAFGTVDAISYRHRILRISDLKTGVTRTSEHQLEVYAALFCLEYGIDPFSMRDIQLRIYQDDSVRPYVGDPYFIKGIMDKIEKFDKILDHLREEVS